jgi:hypothetical protein
VWRTAKPGRKFPYSQHTPSCTTPSQAEQNAADFALCATAKSAIFSRDQLLVVLLPSIAACARNLAFLSVGISGSSASSVGIK